MREIIKLIVGEYHHWFDTRFINPNQPQHVGTAEVIIALLFMVYFTTLFGPESKASRKIKTIQIILLAGPATVFAFLACTVSSGYWALYTLTIGAIILHLADLAK